MVVSEWRWDADHDRLQGGAAGVPRAVGGHRLVDVVAGEHATAAAAQAQAPRRRQGGALQLHPGPWWVLTPVSRLTEVKIGARVARGVEARYRTDNCRDDKIVLTLTIIIFINSKAALSALKVNLIK